MFDKIPLENILFLDIETVPQKKDFNEVDDTLKELWEKKSQFFRKEDESAADVYQRAGIYAEFGKIVCISVGILSKKNGELFFRLKSYFSDNEKELLGEFNQMLEKLELRKEVFLCAHNGKEFDFPYIARRTLINGLPLPAPLQIAGKKPWEIKHIDTMELWKFGDYKHYTSLSLLVTIFGIPTPKDDIDGSQVAEVYWQENNLERIVKYCEKDVLAIAQLYLRYNGKNLLKDSNIESVTF